MDLSERISKLTPEQRKILASKLKGWHIDILEIPITREYRKKYDAFPLSFAQERLWYVHQLGPGNTAYNLVRASRLTGNLNKAALRRSINEIVRRHEILRTTFALGRDKPIQMIQDQLALPLGEIDLKSLPEHQREREVRRVIRSESNHVFDPEKAPLLRTSLIELAEGEHLFLLVIHHIIVDGTSIQVFIRELAQLYETFCRNQPSPLPELPIQYVDYACWQRRWFGGDDLEMGVRKKQEAYWLRQFGGDIPVLNLPSDYSRPVSRSFEGDTVGFRLDRGKTISLKALASRGNTTLYILLLSIVNILLSKLSGSEDIMVGTPVAGRRHPAIRSMIGMFVNTLPLRNSPHVDKSFRDFLKEVREQTLDAFENQEYRYEDIAEKVGINRDSGRNPLFDVVFLFRNVDYAEVNIEGVRLRHYEYESKTSKFDLTLSAREVGDTLNFSFEYWTKLFKDTTIRRFAGFFKQIVRQLIKDVEVKIGDIDCLPSTERQRVLYEFNDTDRQYPGHRTIPGLFEEQVAKKPDRVAIMGRGHGEGHMNLHLTYQQLDEQAGQRAHVLGERGVKKDGIVALMADRSLEVIFAMLAILKAGGAYLPIDPSYPQERIDYMLADSGAETVHASLLMNKMEDKGGIIQGQESQPDRESTPSNLAYVIYTSGSTGRPKGVMVEHVSVINLTFSQKHRFKIDETDRILQFSSFCFDASVEQIFIALFSGAVLMMIDRDVIGDAARFEEFVWSRQVTHVHAVPGFLAHINLRDHRNLRRVISGGDVCPLSLARRLAARHDFYNEYGPTETTVTSIEYQAKRVDDSRFHVPIGRPLANTRAYILDRRQQPVPYGVIGELYIGGDGVARGYLNNPELTAEKFISHQWLSPKSYMLCPKSQILFRTGDLARFLPDGNIEFLGRTDTQVKIRGFRIELAEIEHQLLRHPQVKEAVAVLKDGAGGDRYLCAYFVPSSSQTNKTGKTSPTNVTSKTKKTNLTNVLRHYLSLRLPGYMVPAHFVPLATIPLTSNGKVERKALPEPVLKCRKEHEAPRSFIEKKLVEVCREVLGVESVGLDNNFFGLGGDSIKAIQISARLRRFGLRLEIRDLFLNTTIKQLARSVKSIDRPLDHRAPVEGDVPLTPIQRWLFDRCDAAHLHHFNQSVMLFRQSGFDEEIVKKVFYHLVVYHDALRMTYGIRGGMATQKNRGPEGNFFSMDVFDLRGSLDIPGDIVRECNRIQGGIDLQAAPLVKLGLFRAHGGDHLLVVIHHLVVDGVSWRILLEDFTVGYRQVMAGEEIRLPPRTDSFKQWSLQLWAYAENPQLLKEWEYWKPIEETEISPIIGDSETSARERRYKNSAASSLRLTKRETEQLLQEVHRAYNTEINDILLTALGLALKEWAGLEKVLINLEGHGRESVIGSIDTSRTVGWFTSQFPVILDMEGLEDLGRRIKKVKETLRQIPGRGIGYGILRYLTSRKHLKGFRFRLQPPISFNYLGQFFQEKHQEIAKRSPMPMGNTVHPEIARSYVFDINGGVIDGCLVVSFGYCKQEYEAEQAEGLVNAFKTHLLNIIQHCCLKEEPAVTPSDLEYPGLTIDQLEVLETRLRGNWERIQNIYPLTPMQAGMLFHHTVSKDSAAYFAIGVFSLKGEVGRRLLERSFHLLVERYEALRTIFVSEGLSEPVQIVLQPRCRRFHFEDLSTEREAKKKYRRLDRFMQTEKKQGLDLSRNTPMKLSLFRIDEDAYRLVWSFHHIVMDGWSVGIVFLDLIEIYRSLRSGSQPSLPPTTPLAQYTRWLQRQNRLEGLHYWRRYLDGYEISASLPQSDYPSGSSPYEPAEFHLTINTDMVALMEELTRRYRATVNCLFQAVWGILLQRYNNTDDVLFGVVVSGRSPEVEGIERMVGLFINTVPVRVREDGMTPFARLLEKVQQAALTSRPYQFLPLADIQSESVFRSQLLDHILIFENYPLERKIGDAASLDSDGFVIEKMETTEQTHYDFNLIVAPGSQYLVKFNFNARVYRRDFIHRLSCHFMKALDQAVRDPEINIKEITLLTEGEKEELLIDFNDTRRAYPEDKTIDRLFAEQACQTPHRLALVFEKGQPGLDRTAQRQWHITYTELNGMAAHLSLVLKDRGVCPGTPVGIMLERSIEMISGLLAILKAGGIYLPINPDYPERRRRYMLADSGARLVFTDNSLSGLSRVSPVNHRLFTSNLAYLIYTSGTTGEPKGVMVEHGNVIRLVKNSNYIEFKEGERLLPTGALEFDASTFEIWGALLNGLSLCLVCKKKILAADRFKAVLQKYTITTIWLTSSLFNQMVQADIGIFSGLKNLLLGGEVLLPVHVNRVRKRYPALNVINGYGPTENTTFSTTFLIDREYAERIPIGRPIANSTAYILDRWGKLQPIGVPGELWVGGDGVSRGYLNNPDLTAERFITHQILAPKSYILNPKSQILYRTGDLCRFLPEGDIEFLGRIDHQVKIRGFRIEPGEIENHLLKHPHVKEAVVLAREDEGNEKYLTAYIVPHSTTKTSATSKTNKISLTNEFRHHLSHRLPPYMIPSHFVFLDRVPLTPNGKLDRQALPQPMVETGKDFFAPSGEVEEKLAEIWSEILSVPQETIGVNADFFDLGGHSLRATLLSTRINRELAVKVPMEDIFSKPTLREMAKYIEGVGEKRRGERLLSIDAVEKREYYPLSSAQKRLYILQQMEPNSTVCNIPRVMLLEGKIDLEKLGQVFQQLIRRHEGFRTSFGVVHEEPLQRVHDEVEWGIEYIEPVEPASRDKLIRDFVRPFDLTRPPLLRVGLVQEGHTSQEGNYILMLDVHHIIIDGVSISIFIKEFTDLYRGQSLPPLRCQYKDYSQWQQRFKESREMEKQERYWLNRFSGQIPRLNLPSDFPHPRGQSFDAGTLTFKIDPELTARTRQTARQAGATLYMVLLAVYNVLLAKYSGDEDIVVGMGIFGRRHADLENIVGMFVNMLAMRNEPTPAKTFAEFLEEVKQSAIDAYENQDYQFEELVHKLNISRESGKNPVFEVEFTLHNMDSREIEIPGLKLSFYEYEHKKTKFDLALQARQTGNTITLALSYTTARFKPSTAEYISRHFVEILRQVAEGEDIKLEHIAISRESADVTSRFKQEDFGGFDI